MSAALRAAGCLLEGQEGRGGLLRDLGKRQSNGRLRARPQGAGRAFWGRPQIAGKAAPILSVADEAHLSAEEAQASSDPWIPRTHAHARGALDAEAAARQGPQAAHAVAVDAPGERGR